MHASSYSERLYPAIGSQVALALAIPMTFLAALPFGQATALLAALCGGAIVLGAANLLAPKIEVGDSLLAGKFEIPLSALGELSVLNREEFSKIVGPEANPAAQLLIRGDLKQALKIEIADSSDPTPYVVISSRAPEKLASAIIANRA